MIAFRLLLLLEVSGQLLFGFQQSPETWTNSKEVPPPAFLHDTVDRLEGRLSLPLHSGNFQCVRVKLTERRVPAVGSHRLYNCVGQLHAGEIITRLAPGRSIRSVDLGGGEG